MTARPPSSLPWRWLLVDVDGTLLNTADGLTPRMHAALEQALAAGLTLVLATGRTYPSLQRILGNLGLPFHMITNGGAVALAPGGGEVRYTRFMDTAVWGRAVAALQAEELTPLVFSHRHPEPPLFYTSPRPGGDHFDRYVHRNRHLCRVVADLAAETIPNVVQVAALGKGPDFDAASARAMARLNGHTRHHSMVLYLDATFGKITEFFDRSVSKWEAFVGLFPEAAAHPEWVIAAGDEANDLEMLQAAGLSIAMGNAIPELKAVADLVAEPVEKDGLALAIESLLARQA